MWRIALVLVAAICSLSVTETSALAGPNCQAKLVGNSYACTVATSGGTTGTDCFEFNTGTVSKFFDFFDATHHYGCTCDVTGSTRSPSFNKSSNSFECDDGAGTQVTGKIKGKKISGQGSNANGDSFIYKCTIGPSCG